MNNAGSWLNQCATLESSNHPSNLTVTTVTSCSIVESDCLPDPVPLSQSVDFNRAQLKTQICRVNASTQAVFESLKTRSGSSYDSSLTLPVIRRGGVVVEGLIVRTEDEEEAEAEAERNRSIHLIPYRPTPRQRSSSVHRDCLFAFLFTNNVGFCFCYCCLLL